MSDSRGKPLDLEDLAMLNQQIASFVRAGIPLESGLAAMGKAREGASDVLMLRLSQRLREGKSLSEAVEQDGSDLPQVYRAIIAAGTRTGRLADALEALAGFARTTLELRQRIDLALLYPALVVLLAAFLFVLLVQFWVPGLSETFASLQLPASVWLQRLDQLRDALWWWSPIVPACVVLGGVWWWVSSRGRYGLRGTTDSPAWSAFSVVPGLRSIVTNFHRASFCDLLALLLEHRVPLPEAALVAADAAGDRSLRRVATRIADGVRSGHSLADCLVMGRELPPFLSWMLISGERQGNLSSTLRQMAEVLRQRATAQSDWLRVLLPSTLVVVLGGGAVLVYALTVFGPLSQLWQRLGGLNP